MKEKYMKDFNGEKIFSLEYDKETLKDMVLDKQEENIKLHSIIKEVREYIQDRYDGAVLTYTFDKDIVKELLEILDKVDDNQ